MDATVFRRTGRIGSQPIQSKHYDVVFLDTAMLVITLMFLLLGLGCAGPDLSLTDEHATIREDACSTRPHKAEYEGQSSKACRPQRTWLQDVGTTLSGAAPAFSTPRP
jgi:hypothetical protein